MNLASEVYAALKRKYTARGWVIVIETAIIAAGVVYLLLR